MSTAERPAALNALADDAGALARSLDALTVEMTELRDDMRLSLGLPVYDERQPSLPMRVSECVA